MKYGISQKGVDSMNQLANDLKNFNSEIEQCGTALSTKIGGLHEGLGLFADQIDELVAAVKKTADKGRDAATTLSQKAKDRADQIAGMLTTKI